MEIVKRVQVITKEDCGRCSVQRCLDTVNYNSQL